MLHADLVRTRQLERAHRAGERWQALTERRAETVRLLRSGGPERADSPERVARFHAREDAKRLAFARAGVTESFFTERRIGPTLDLDDFPPNEPARLAGMPVGRIVALDRQSAIQEGFATGFLIAPSLLMTNHHVFAEAAETVDCGVQFLYEKGPGGDVGAGVVFSLDAGLFFYANEELDFAIVGVALTSSGGQPLTEFNSLPLSPVIGKILVGQPISIIQYPDGGPKKYGVRDNELLLAPADREAFLQYSTDTLPGSSGSPAFNKDWEVVALHHSGVPEIRDGQILTIDGRTWTRGMPDSDIHWVANEGVRISAICTHLAAAQVSAAYRPALTGLLQSVGEDLASLPAIRSQQRGAAMTTTTTTPAAAERLYQVVVNGTANFYANAPAPAAQVTRAVAALPAAAPSTIEKKLRFDPDYGHRRGYQKDFLDVDVPLPDVSAARAGELLKSNGHPLVLKYHHYSLVMNRQRRLMMWSAVNVDYTKSKRRKTRDQFGTDTWIADPRISGDQQIQDPELYEPAAKFDRGHIVRRDDTAWGDTAEEEILANSDSFHWTNCTPQHEQFNRDQFGFHGLWGGLENQIQDQAKNVRNTMSIFAGPVLDDANDIRHDFGAGDVQIPRRFWKVLLVVEDAGSPAAALRAFGFVLDQSKAINQFGIERFSAGEFEVFQRSLDEISAVSGVTFPAVVVAADVMAGSPEESRRRPLRSFEDVRGLRGAGYRAEVG
jgi:endonuclease G